jgi:hypothetical protein
VTPPPPKAVVPKMYCSLYAVFLGCHTHMPPSIYGVEGTYSHLTNELYAIASHSNYDRSRDHWCRAWRCLRVNKGLLIGLRAFKRAQLSLRLTVRTLTRPCIAQLSRNRRAVENERRRADWDSVLSSLGDVLRGLPERSRFLTVLASLWRCKSLDITLCDTPNWSAILRRLYPVFRMPMTSNFCSSVNLRLGIIKMWIWMVYTDNNSTRNTLRLIARNLQGEIWWVA